MAVGITLGLLLLVLLIGYAFNVILLILAGVLIAIFFRGTARWLSNRIPLSEGWSLAIVVMVVLAVISLTVWLLAPRISEQAVKLSEELPRAVEGFRGQIAQSSWGRSLINEIPSAESFQQNSGNWLKRSFGVLSSTFGVLADIYVILFLAIFITAQPKIYKEGIVALVSIPKRGRAREVLNKVGATLYKWLLGKLFSMLIVGVFTAVGLGLIGIPLALVLGLIAGLFSFIPNFGPLLALVPAALVALLQGPQQALYVIVLYVGIQAVESNAITPFIQNKMIKIPPALIIVAQLLLGVFSGGLGLILATPIIAAVMVLVRMLYVKDVLGDESVEVK